MEQFWFLMEERNLVQELSGKTYSSEVSKAQANEVFALKLTEASSELSGHYNEVYGDFYEHVLITEPKLLSNLKCFQIKSPTQ